MSKKNVNLVRSFYDAASTGDFGGAARLLDPQVEWIEPEVAELWCGGTHRGSDTVFKEVIEPSYDKFDQLTLERDEFLDAKDQIVVVGRFRGRGRNTGAELSAPFVHIWKIENGKIVRFQNFMDTANVLNALGGVPAEHGGNMETNH